jgi:hypothetical protein
MDLGTCYDVDVIAEDGFYAAICRIINRNLMKTVPRLLYYFTIQDISCSAD